MQLLSAQIGLRVTWASQ